MSKINETVGQIQKVMIEGQPQSVRLIFQTYKISGDADTQELIKVFAAGVDILLQIEGKDCTYVIVKKIERLKLAL